MNKEQTQQALIDRYVYDVCRRLPKKQRGEIEPEIRGLIGDMMEAEPSLSVQDILIALGTPAELAKNYRDEERFIIGPESYDSYMLVCRLCLFAVLASFAVSVIVKLAAGSDAKSLAYLLGDQLISSLTGAIMVVGFVTLIFAVLEHRKIPIDFDGSKGWNPDKLPPVPHKKVLISRGETITGIIFLLVFMGLLLCAPQLFGAWHTIDGAHQSIPLFNIEFWPTFTPILILLFGISLIDEIIKLVTGRYCLMVAISVSVSNILILCITTYLLKFLPFWNPDFVIQLELAYGIQVNSAQDILMYWNTSTFSNGLLAVIVVIALIEIGTAIYKTIRYSY